MGQKIATCCYCGTRAALVLGGSQQHQLACGNCGAPLQDLKSLKTGTSKTSGKSQKRSKAPPHRVESSARFPLPSAKHLKNRYTRKLQRKLTKKALKAVLDLFD